MKIEGINGASTFYKEVGSVELLNWKHSFKQPTRNSRSAGQSGAIGKAKHKNIYFTKQLDVTTRDLIKKCWQGSQIPKITISSYNSDVKFLEIVLEKSILASYKLSEDTYSAHPMERIGINYSKIKYSYIPVDEKGVALGKLPVEHNIETGVIA
jgi:type VI secretion system Hcp family effector